MNIITYWIIRIILLAILIYSGYNIAYKDEEGSKFWKYATPSWIAYSLIQGLRYMRGQDYYHYMGDLQGNLFEYADYSKNPLYLVWLDLFQATGLHFAFGFVFYSAILFFAFLLVVREFPKAALWALPLFLIDLPETENLIRQYFALSFFIIGLGARLKGKSKWLEWSMYMSCILIHYSGFLPIILLLLLEFGKERIKWSFRSPILLLSIYVFVYFFWESSYYGFIADFLSTINLGDNVAGSDFLVNADRWFTEEGSISLILGSQAHVANNIVLTLRFLIDISIIYFGLLAIKEQKSLSVLYWFAYFVIILRVIGGDIEIYNRFRQWMAFATPVICGAILGYCEMKPIVKRSVTALFIVYYLLYNTLYQFGTMGYSGCAFIWDM